MTHSDWGTTEGESLFFEDIATDRLSLPQCGTLTGASVGIADQTQWGIISFFEEQRLGGRCVWGTQGS